MDRVLSLAREYGAAVDLPHDRRRGPGPHRRLEAARRQAHLRHRHRALRHRTHRPDLRHAHVPARPPATTTSAATRWRPSRRSGASRPSCPGASTILGLSNVSLRAQARGPPRAQQRVPARVPRGRARRRDRARGAHHAAAPDRRPRARGRARPHLRPPPRRLRPAHRVHGAVRRRRGRRDREGGPLGLAGRGAARSTASSTATATASKPTSTSSSRRCPRSRSSTTCCSTA